MTPSEENQILVYIADLELEVDRLQSQANHIYGEISDFIKKIQGEFTADNGSNDCASQLSQIKKTALELVQVVHDIKEPLSYHPANDQVVAIAIRPLIEQIFRWQLRLLNATAVSLRLDLAVDYIEWFPARLRHILDNVIASAIRYRDTSKGETRVNLALRVSPKSYELHISDNGRGMPLPDGTDPLEMLTKFRPIRPSGFGVGLAVVKMLVEQSDGSIQKISDKEIGTAIQLILPRYDLADFLESCSN